MEASTALFATLVRSAALAILLVTPSVAWDCPNGWYWIQFEDAYFEVFSAGDEWKGVIRYDEARWDSARQTDYAVWTTITGGSSAFAAGIDDDTNSLDRMCIRKKICIGGFVEYQSIDVEPAWPCSTTCCFGYGNWGCKEIVYYTHSASTSAYDESSMHFKAFNYTGYEDFDDDMSEQLRFSVAKDQNDLPPCPYKPSVDYYSYRNSYMGSNMCMDISGSDPTKVHAWGCHGNDNQKWMYKDKHLVSKLNSDKVIVVNGDPAIYRKLTIGKKSDSNSKWELYGGGDDYLHFQFKLVGTNYCIGIAGSADGVINNGDRLELHRCSSTNPPVVRAMTWSPF